MARSAIAIADHLLKHDDKVKVKELRKLIATLIQSEKNELKK